MNVQRMYVRSTPDRGAKGPFLPHLAPCPEVALRTIVCTQHHSDCHTGADVQKGKYWDTPLHAAAQQSSTEVVNLLLEFGADINAKNTELLRPVDVATSSSLVERLLLQREGKKGPGEHRSHRNVCLGRDDLLLACKLIVA